MIIFRNVQDKKVKRNKMNVEFGRESLIYTRIDARNKSVELPLAVSNRAPILATKMCPPIQKYRPASLIVIAWPSGPVP